MEEALNCYGQKTINAMCYCDTLSKLKKAAWTSHLWWSAVGWQCQITFRGDNAKFEFSWERLHHLLPALKENLRARCFESNTEVKQSVPSLFHMQNPDFFPGGPFETYQAIWLMSQCIWHLYGKIKVCHTFNVSFQFLTFIHNSDHSRKLIFQLFLVYSIL